MRAATLALFLALAACTQFPELDSTVVPNLENAEFPELVPLEPLMARTSPVVADADRTTQALDARVAALRARAAALQRRDIVDQDTETRPGTTGN